MEPIKPGTRCECRSDSQEHLRYHADGWIHPEGRHCSANAVRTVTVRDQAGNIHPTCVTVTGPDMVTGITGIPLCAACAEFHERKQGDSYTMPNPAKKGT